MSSYYKQSLSILQEIKKAKNILINVHKNPDFDTVASSLAIRQVLNSIGKNTTIICPHIVPSDFTFLPGCCGIKTIDYELFDFKPFDLFLLLDSSSFDRVTGSKSIPMPNLTSIVIDHHEENTLDGAVKLVDTEACATAEMLYTLFTDWNVVIDSTIASLLLAGIAGDTVFFKYNMVSPHDVFKMVTDLISKGANIPHFVSMALDNQKFESIQLLGLFLEKMKLEKNFVWAAVPFNEYITYGKPSGVREMAADSFFRCVEKTDFGIAMLETKKGSLEVSFRSKPNTDVSIVARTLGGGGHKNAAGCTIFGDFDKAVSRVIDTAKKIPLDKF